ncbi:MAG: tRNA 2-thiouridine(34) synthase MnmA [Oscillospiraceae bacterium]|nr:tRNA 2-thiouridine(34) synthase MnmA [Oscillospiraceae bacterium]
MSTANPALFNKRILVALSGGVDSSVAVKLLHDEGYEVAGVVMKMSDAHDGTVSAAQSAADALGIKLFVLDLRDEFKKTVIDFFAEEYLNGRTPSPCVRCNPNIKFKYLLKTALDNGFDRIATGHYAKVINDDGVYKLLKSDNDARDQSYMLAGLGQDVLSRIVFPLWGMAKDDVRTIAKDLGLECASAPDSEENCFVPDNDYAGYIERNYRASERGNFISPEGKPCGEHKGIIHYTVGQRKGLGIALGRPCYVTEIDADTNEVKLGYERAMTDRVLLSNISETFPDAIKDGMSAKCKLRSTGKLLDCKVALADGGCVLTLDTPTPRVPAGQAGVLYDGNVVLGMGTIE